MAKKCEKLPQQTNISKQKKKKIAREKLKAKSLADAAISHDICRVIRISDDFDESRSRQHHQPHQQLSHDSLNTYEYTILTFIAR